MEENKVKIIRDIQEIIDFLSANNKDEANLKWIEVNEYLNDLLDINTDDVVLIELNRYQLLLKHLYSKINS